MRCNRCWLRSSRISRPSPELVLAAHLGEQLLDIDIDLAGGADVADFKAVGREAILDEPDFLDRDPVLALRR